MLNSAKNIFNYIFQNEEASEKDVKDVEDTGLIFDENDIEDLKDLKDKELSESIKLAYEEVEEPVKHSSFKRMYDWVPGTISENDQMYQGYTFLSNNSSIDMRSYMPPVYDQGHLGSCTANALAAAFDYVNNMEHNEFYYPSRLFIYWQERNLEHTVQVDTGASLSDGVKILHERGVCKEELYPYEITQFRDKPDASAFLEASNHTVLKYSYVRPDVNSFKHALANMQTVVFGFRVPESFEEIKEDGIMKMPKLFEKVVGGHAVLAVGYDDNKTANGHTGYFIVRNSWGKSWGQDGYFYMPYDFIHERCEDCWVLERVT